MKATRTLEVAPAMPEIIIQTNIWYCGIVPLDKNILCNNLGPHNI